jgi:hypothetical protein
LILLPLDTYMFHLAGESSFFFIKKSYIH